VQRCGIEVGSVWPHERVCFGVDSNLSEELGIAKWTVQLARQYRGEIDLLLRAVLELHSQGMSAEALECTNAV